MSEMTPTHIVCNKKRIAKTVLLPGDPLRAKWIANTFLEKPRLVNKVRNMLGYTGYFKGKQVTVMGAGMGIPSMAIYVEELARFYGVETIIRVGSCGSLKKGVNLGDIVIPISASTDSNKIALRFNPLVHYAPAPDGEFYFRACVLAREYLTAGYKTGGVYSTDSFYQDGNFNGPDEIWRRFAEYGNIVVEMETAELFTLGYEHNIKTLSLLTVSDHLVTFKKMTPKERESGLSEMVKLALLLV